MSNHYSYSRGSRYGQESVDFHLRDTRTNDYVTTCVVNVDLLLNGIRTHPCGDGRDLVLNDSHALEVLELVKKERDAIKFSGKPKSLDGWENSGLNLCEYLAVGDEVDEALVDYQMNCVPPRSHTSGYLQVGEAYADALDPDDPQERYRATYTTFHMKRDGDRQFWIYAGHCFTGQDVNRLPERDKAGAAIREIKTKMGVSA